MGGRGSSSGISVNGKPYGTEYKAVLDKNGKPLVDGNVKFVQRVDNSTNAPLETMTKRRVYVTVTRDGVLKFISYYDKDNKRTKTIDLTKPHDGVSPHTHHGYEHNEDDSSKGYANLTVEERNMVDRIRKLWYNHINGK